MSNKPAVIKFGKKIDIHKTLLTVFMAVVVVIQLFPLYWLLSFSLKNNNQIFGGNILGLPEKFMWNNYVKVLTQGNVGVYLLNSVIVTAASVVITCLLAASAAYAITRMNWGLSKTVLNIFLLGMMIPAYAALLPLFLTLNKTGIYDTWFALIIPYTAFSLPMAIFIFTGFYETIPRELEESACMDGCSIYRIFSSIMLPMIRPAIVTVAIFTYLQNWNELLFAVTFIKSRNLKTLTAGVMSLVSQYRTEWGQIGAGLLLTAIPSLLIYTFLSKQVQESFRAGAIKG